MKAKTRRVAVYELDASGFDPRIARVLTDAVLAEVRKLEKTTVVGMDEIRAMLDVEAQKQLVGCTDASCLSEIAESLGVDMVIIGTVATVGDGLTFGLKNIDQRSATTLVQATRRIDSSDPADVLAAVGPVVQELFPDVALKPGAVRGVPPEVALRIHPPPLSPWVFWTLTGASGVAAASGALFTVWNAAAYSAATEKAASSVKGPAIAGSTLNADLATVRLSFVGLASSFGAAAALGVGAAVSAAFVNWDERAE